MTRRTALLKELNLQDVKAKLTHGGQILPFGPPPVAAQRAMTERIFEAMSDNDQAKRSEMLDRLWHATIGQVSTGLSPAALHLAYADWIAHLAMSPNRQFQMAQNAIERWSDLGFQAFRYGMGEEEACCPQDTRFHERYQHEDWRRWPYNILASAHLSAEDWWEEISKIRGMTGHHQRMVTFMHLLFLSASSPENCWLLNPEVIAKTRAELGLNFIKGAGNVMEDIRRWWGNEPPAGVEDFVVGKDVAVTKGKVVFRNALFELIQYSPRTRQVYPEPVLIIPAWIMKYYILDLSPQNSMVKYLVEQGHTVFMISWKNPDARYRDVDFTDYLKEGALQALNVVCEIVPGRKIHAVGYCIGGTLLAMLAAHLANKRQDTLQTLTLFAAQVDFTEAGQLMAFIDEAQVTYLEDIMFSQGYLRGDQVSAAFNLLKPRELIWSRLMKEYLLGERGEMFDLMAWDKDTTRLPYRMHAEYLHMLYLGNGLAEGEYDVDGDLLDLNAITTPMFVVSTERDHIAPWKSVYKIHHLTDAEITFVLANKGHNGGIVSEPGRTGREYRITTRTKGGRTIQTGKWMAQQKPKTGSWWVEWHEWLATHSGKPGTPPATGSKIYSPLANAPGEYVYEY